MLTHMCKTLCIVKQTKLMSLNKMLVAQSFTKLEDLIRAEEIAQILVG